MLKPKLNISFFIGHFGWLYSWCKSSDERAPRGSTYSPHIFTTSVTTAAWSHISGSFRLCFFSRCKAFFRSCFLPIRPYLRCGPNIYKTDEVMNENLLWLYKTVWLYSRHTENWRGISRGHCSEGRSFCLKI